MFEIQNRKQKTEGLRPGITDKELCDRNKKSCKNITENNFQYKICQTNH